MDEDLIERLEAEAKVSDAEPEELTVAVESDVEETEEQVEELESDLSEKESKVEELEAQVDEKDSEVEELQEEVETVKEFYAEELAEDSGVLDEDDYTEKFDVAELREKFDALEDEDPEPNPGSADPGANIQSPEDEGGEGSEAEELSEKERVAASAFEARSKNSQGSDAWDDIAEDIRNGGE